MGIIAVAVRHLIAAGVTDDALISAIADMESSAPIDIQAEKRRQKDRERKSRLRSSADSADSAELAESPSPDGSDGFLEPSLTSLAPIKENPPKGGQKKVSLAELAVDHIADWLAEKRSQGRYLAHDEHFVLDQFKNYCQSKGKKYANYIAGYRNAFEWERCQPRLEKPNKDDRAKAAIMRGLGLTG